MSITICSATAADRADWSRLWDAYLAFYKTARGGDVHDATWARIMDPDKAMFALVARDAEGSAIGICNYLLHNSFWDIEPKCYLNDLFVDPAVRGSGAGRAMIERVHTHAQELGAVATYWLTAEDNVPARRLYDTLSNKTPFVHYAKA